MGGLPPLRSVQKRTGAGLHGDMNLIVHVLLSLCDIFNKSLDKMSVTMPYVIRSCVICDQLYLLNSTLTQILKILLVMLTLKSIRIMKACDTEKKR